MTTNTRHAIATRPQLATITRKLFAAALVLGLVFGPQLVAADGSHGSKANVINKSDNKIVLYVFNGGDNVRQVPHKTYTVKKGENQRIKCHGNGKGRCWISNTLSSSDDDLKIYKGETCDLHFNIFTGLELKNCD